MAYEAARWRDDPGLVRVLCNYCIHKHYDADLGRVYCDAFPDGLTNKHFVTEDMEIPEQCNNGIKYERIPDDPQ